MSVFSYSRLETFKQCPRKYYYRYVVRVRMKDQPETIAAFVGSRVHEALQFVYERTQFGKVLLAREAIEYFQRC